MYDRHAVKRVLLPIALVTLAALSFSASAFAVTQTVRSGPVTASFSYTRTTARDGFMTFSKEKVTITRAGVVAYSAMVKDPDCGTGRFECDPGVVKGSSIRLVDIDRSGEPNVVLSLFSGGASCCFIGQVFTYSAALGGYVESGRNFGNDGYTLKRLSPGADYDFVSANDAFMGAFTADSGSGLPLQILSFAGLKFVDVTRSHPGLLAKDAAFWIKLFRAHSKRGEGPLGAWAADEELLGHNRLVQSTLAKQLKAGHLVGGFVNGKRYIAALNKLLRRQGYLKKK
jgi:hypothetical protein